MCSMAEVHDCEQRYRGCTITGPVLHGGSNAREEVVYQDARQRSITRLEEQYTLPSDERRITGSAGSITMRWDVCISMIKTNIVRRSIY